MQRLFTVSTHNQTSLFKCYYSVGLEGCNNLLTLLVQHFLWEDNIELDDQVSTWAFPLQTQLGLRVHDDVPSLAPGHALAFDPQFCLW